jgi:hypothetical protein
VFGGKKMKKLLLPVAMILLVSAGCLFAPAATTTNALPIAYIDSVSPTNIMYGEIVTFAGHGVDPDPDGTIIAYSWRSSRDGDLSAESEFSTSSLSVGTHTIWFRIEDNNQVWSDEVMAVVNVFAPGATKPAINSFTASPGSIKLGESSTLSWSVSGCTTVSIDQAIGNVSLSGTRVVSPTKTTTYTLKAVNEVGTSTATAHVVVGEIPVTSVELYSIAAEDGQVRRDGYVGQEPNVGDTKSGTTIQAFVSYDISMIPKGAVITSSKLDLTAAGIYGEPFSKLGMLLVYDCKYQTLKASDFAVGPVLGALYTIPVPPSQPITTPTITNAIQKKVDAGDTRFQLRFQFEKPQFYNNQADYVALGEGRTQLTIEYQY